MMNRVHPLHVLLATVLTVFSLTSCNEDDGGFVEDLFSEGPYYICENESFGGFASDGTLIGQYALVSDVDCSLDGCVERVAFPLATVVLELRPDGTASGAFLTDSLATWSLDSPPVMGAAPVLRFQSALDTTAAESFSVTATGSCRLRVETGQRTAVFGRLFEF